MAFCKNCGAQLDGNEKFCVKCGTPIAANGAAVPAANGPALAMSIPPPQPIPPPVYAAAMVAPPVAAMPPRAAANPYAAFGPPVMVPLPQAPPARHSWTAIVIVLAALAAGGYYYQKHQAAPAAPQPGTAPTPTQPGTAPAPGGAPAQPGGAPAQPGDNQALVQQQAFAGHWTATNGFIVISNGVWKNNSNVAIQSSVLECDQFNAGKTDLAQMKINLTVNAPVPPGSSASFNPFQMGGVAANMSAVNCMIVGVTPVAGGGQ